MAKKYNKGQRKKSIKFKKKNRKKSMKTKYASLRIHKIG